MIKIKTKAKTMSKKKARHSLIGVYPGVSKYSYLRRYGSLRGHFRALEQQQ